MDLRQLECVVAVARHEHVTRAAEALHLTQSAVSQHVLRLEAELGVRLFERSARGTTPTAAGRELLARAEAVLAEVGRARTAMAAHAAPGGAVVRVVAAPAEVAGLAATLAALATGGDAAATRGTKTSGVTTSGGAVARGDAAIAVRHAGAAEAIDVVRRGDADLAVCAPVRPPADLDAIPLRPDPLVLLGATTADLAALRDRPVLLPPAGTAARAAAAEAFAAAGFSPLPRFEVADPADARALVAAGAAAAVVPASWAADLPSQPLPGAEPVRPLLLHRPGLPPAAAALADALRAALG